MAELSCSRINQRSQQRQADQNRQALGTVLATGPNGAATAPQRRLGLLQGQCQVPDNFDQLGAAEIADLFESN